MHARKIDHAHFPINLPGISVSTAHFLIEAEELLKSTGCVRSVSAG